MSVVEVTEGIIDLIKKNMIAKSNLESSVLTGEILINVENSFHYNDGEEIVLIDFTYNTEGAPHHNVYEYAVIKEVNNTHWITLDQAIQDPNGGWLISNNAFIQKTIGHSPLYDDRVYYGDREVIPTEDMAVTVEPLSLSNEWIYIHGGLSEEYRVGIIIYGKDIETEEGMKILNMYADSIYKLFNKSMHIDINNYDAPLVANVAAGTTTVIVENTSDNREYFQVSSVIPDDEVYEIQDNNGIEIDLFVSEVSTSDEYIYITVNQNDPAAYGIEPIARSYCVNEYAVFRRHGRYFYDSRIDNIEYGVVQKGSAFIRAARLNWFGKEVTEYRFPQRSLGVAYFKEITSPLEHSSSSSSSSSSSIDSSSSSSSIDSSSSSSIDSSSSSSSSNSSSSSSNSSSSSTDG
jgi:hypothetical protein